MRKHLLLSFVPMTIAVAAAGPPSPVHADESSKPDHAMLLASNAPGTQHGVGFGIVTVSAPQPLPAGRTSVTLWDEIPPPPQLPMPLPIPQPGDVQHAMEGTAQGSTHQ
ncbi:hypothetical protein CEQ23_07045 [Burkholderia cepacia]|uniref:Uncharacterized protein n=2 Tax=Burkholderia cepacia TaxID=292 RepID=A0ABN5CW67_BURCE|nr:hypothetical protein [Burkholderia cepacia]AIO24513.1 hypothetical protein DM41_2332 [Burkholderia cepacia ATCC 25416]ALK17943.1 hypothetical protein APZ15_09120 [Burkholderia cepacia ATCC 25416]ASE93413.1 hypothetical protein CEQ23_07045 [Burkholderia cepacia]ATF78415.1 hypothetical protein CO711_13945 [Burkholderia cepacia]QCY02640.1 hypothetical protein EJ998_05595 [Burkholderia cepacia ATCC 25416]